MNRTWTKISLLLLAFMITAIACRKKDAPLPDNVVSFEATEQGLAESASAIEIKVKLSGAASTSIPVGIRITPSAGVEYGTQFTTSPAAVAGVVTPIVLSGSNEATFTVTKVPDALFYGDEKIVFDIISSGPPVIINTSNTRFTLSFAEIISGGSSVVGQGGGATYGNKVFFDLSANTQIPVQRTMWDLGFYSGDDYRVILNSSTAMMAKAIDKNDLNAVTAADTVGFSNDVVFNQAAPSAASLAYIDYPNGDLTRTAIAEVSATATDNKVYIVNRGTGIGSPAPARGWKKIRIIRNASGGYTLQHADIAATTSTSVDIPKDGTYFFKYVSFETGATDVEPLKTKWDLAWTYFSNVTNFGGGEVPYLFQDVILQNRNVEVNVMATSTRAYEEFTEADIAGLTFGTSQTMIGSGWRAGGGPTTQPAVTTTRYYILKDGDGNYYKLRFTALTSNGERGFPAFEFVLLRRG